MPPRTQLPPPKAWKKGVSGNPSGPKPGYQHKITRLAAAMVGDEGEKVIRKCIDMALAGNETALRLIVERILPPRKMAPLSVALRQVKTTADVSEAASELIEKTASGEMTPDEAMHIANLVEYKRRAIETQNLAARLEALEEREARRGGTLPALEDGT